MSTLLTKASSLVKPVKHLTCAPAPKNELQPCLAKSSHSSSTLALTALKIGLHYHKRKAYTLAAKWLIKAAEQDNAEAQLTLGVMYANGQGVPLDIDMACHWLVKCTENGPIKFTVTH